MQSGSATLDMTLTMLKNMALSPAFATEVAVYKATLAELTPMDIPILDANRQPVTVRVSPDDGLELGYIADQLAAVYITEQEKLKPPFPLLELVGRPGRPQNSTTANDRFTTEIVEGEVYSIDAVMWSSQGDAKHTELEAMTLAKCFKQLVRRNERLSNLVQLIQALGPVEPAGGGSYAGTLLQGARIRFEVLVLS